MAHMPNLARWAKKPLAQPQASKMFHEHRSCGFCPKLFRGGGHVLSSLPACPIHSVSFLSGPHRPFIHEPSIQPVDWLLVKLQVLQQVTEKGNGLGEVGDVYYPLRSHSRKSSSPWKHSPPRLWKDRWFTLGKSHGVKDDVHLDGKGMQVGRPWFCVCLCHSLAVLPVVVTPPLQALSIESGSHPAGV